MGLATSRHNHFSSLSWMFRGFTNEERPWADVNLKNHRIPAFITSGQQTLIHGFGKRNMFSKLQPNYFFVMFASKHLVVKWWCSPGHLWSHSSHGHQWELHDQCLSCRSCHSLHQFLANSFVAHGSTGPLGATFSEGITELQCHAKNFHQIFATNHPKKIRFPRHMVMFSDCPKATNWSKVASHCSWAKGRTKVLSFRH